MSRGDHYQSAAQLQKYGGIAPVTERSGKSAGCSVGCMPQVPTPDLRRVGSRIHTSFWTGTYYQSQRHKGSSHQAASRAVAFKWIHILYRCGQTQTPYNESTYLNALQGRGSPLLNSIAQAA